ncbi:membrane-spanning 4-domains subfamily A member 4D-like isoform X1 [Lissotriton helveticus]
MSTTEKEDGCVVITGVDPQGEPSKMGAGAIRSPMRSLQRFYEGEPVALGVTLIVCGIIQIFLGIIHDVNDRIFLRYGIPLLLTGAPVWSGILCIISGSLSVAAANKPRIGLVRGSLATNIISAVTSMASMLIYIAYMLARSIFSIWRSSCDYNYPEMCDKVNQTQMVSTGIMFILLTFSVLQFCVSVSVSAFGCKTICRTAYSEVNVVIYQAAPPNSADPGVSTVL